MMETQTFLWSWRGFLAGTRRSWHAHQRVHLEGYRGDHLVVKHSTQVYQLRRAAALVTHLFARGGQAWGFNLLSESSATRWGNNHAGWRPGVLTNSFGFHLRRVHLVRRLRRVVPGGSGRLPGRRASRRRRLARRWTRKALGRGLRRRVYSSRIQRKFIRHDGFSGQVVRLTGGALRDQDRGWWTLSCQPTGGYVRSRWLRPWWPATGRTHVTGSSHFPRVGWRGFSPTRLFSSFARKVSKSLRRRRSRSVRAVRTARAEPGLPGSASEWISPVGRKRPKLVRRGQYQRWPTFFPSFVVTGKLSLLESSILGEASVVGTPVVSFGGADLTPRVSLFPVLWNSSATEGASEWLDTLVDRSVRMGLFRTLWIRLGTS